MIVSGKKTIESIRYIFVELLIVFIGVYLAFLLSEYSSERETNQRRQQLRAALAQEIDVFLQGASHLLPQLDTLYKDWRHLYELKQMPAPLHFEVGGADLPPRGMWQAVLSSNDPGILSVESMQKVSDYYNALDILLDKYSNLIEFSEREIIPFKNKSTFYDSGQKTLKRKYAAYMRRMKDMLNLFRTVQQKAEKSKASLH